MKMFPIRKILCPTDFSEPSFTGLKIANELAEQFSAELILVHVITPVDPYPSPSGSVVSRYSMYYDEIYKASKISLDEAAQNNISSNVAHRTIMFQGNPADQIVEAAESEKVDMIVTATHGWTGWRRFFFGSVAEKVVRSARCPVLTVPAPQQEK